MSPLNQTLSQLRGTYSGEEFDVTDADQNPMLQFGKWIGEAISSSCDEPNAFTLSTINQNL
jgi:pyridoxamine 5'-phosphate oxidase